MSEISKKRSRGPSLTETHPEVLLDWNDSNRDPNQLTYGSGLKVEWKCHKCSHLWTGTPNNRIKKGVLTGCPSCVGGRLHSSGENSLAALRPELSIEWHPVKNFELNAEQVTVGSDYRAWWQCKDCEHEWQTAICNRTGLDNGCPCCNIGRLHSRGINSLAMVNAKLASQWHPTKNQGLTPFDVVANTNKKVWWLCNKSQCEHPHEWIANINSRTGGSNCPYCYGNHSFCPCDSIATTHPELAAELHPDEPLDPTELSKGSDKVVLWLCNKSQCEHEHSWRSQVKSRALKDTGCAYCAGKIVCKCNSFGTLFPEKASQWSEKNGVKSPFDYTAHSNKIFWWKCEKGPDHEWKGPISDRTRKDQHGGCPFCKSRRVSITNCLATKNPNVAKMWHPALNGELTPNDVLPGTPKRVWWKCQKGPDHEWKVPVGRLTSNATSGSGCPFCQGYQLSVTNRLDVHYPNLVDEWHPEKNGEKIPSEFTTASNKKMWWKCSKCDREWKAAINNRTAKKPRGCAACASHGFDPTAPAFYYAMEIRGPSDLWWYKGGIAADPEHRRYIVERSLKQNGMHLDVKVVQVIQFDVGADAKKFEKKMLRVKKIRAKTNEKFDGSTELFNTNPILHAQENELLDSRKSSQMKLDDFY
jgi:hypothetical protein